MQMAAIANVTAPPIPPVNVPVRPAIADAQATAKIGRSKGIPPSMQNLTKVLCSNLSLRFKQPTNNKQQITNTSTTRSLSARPAVRLRGP